MITRDITEELVQSAAALYNGGQPFDVRGVRVLNPLHVEDIWETLTEPSEKRF